MHEFKFTLLLLLAFQGVCCMQDATAQEWDEVKIVSHPLTKNVYMLEGSGGNIGVLINDDHVLVIDSQFDPLFDKIKASIEQLSDLPIRYLINTHWHRDHVSGNARFDEIGATLIAHEVVKTRLILGGKVDFFESELPPQSREAIPDLTFTDEVTMNFGSEQIRMFYVPNAHTDCDIIVHMRENNAIHMGDAYFSGMYPFFDLSSGGKIKGVIAACDQALALCDEDTKIIPGHGALSNSAELSRYRDMLTDVVTHVEKAMAEGATLEDVQESAPQFMKVHEAEFGGGFIDAKTLILFVYNSL